VTTAEDRLGHGRFCNTCQARPLPLRSRRPERAGGENLARSHGGRTPAEKAGASRAPPVVFSYAAPSLFTPLHASLFLLDAFLSPLLSSRRVGTRATPPPLSLSPLQYIRFPEEMKFSQWFTVLNTRLCVWTWSVCAVFSPVILPRSQPTDAQSFQQSVHGKRLKESTSVRGDNMARFQASTRAGWWVAGSLSLCFCAVPSCHACMGGTAASDQIHSFSVAKMRPR
jgi:hypothetical protein